MMVTHPTHLPVGQASGKGWAGHRGWTETGSQRECLLPTHPRALAPHQPIPYMATMMLQFPQLTLLLTPQSQKEHIQPLYQLVPI